MTTLVLPDKRTELPDLLEWARAFFRRFIVVTDAQADVVALWNAHSYVVMCSRATPYLHFISPEPGSGKTTALEVLELISYRGETLDDTSGPGLFRFIEQERPTLLYDEVDGVFKKRNSDSTEDIRKILCSGYRQGKRVIRMRGPQHDQLGFFDPFCPKALAGIGPLPGTLAHRTIPIDMQPPRPDESYEDFDPEEAEDEASKIRLWFESWADVAEPSLRDRSLKPAKLPEHDARGNEIWRILLRIADLAGGRWPEAARQAARDLSGGERGRETSIGVRLLSSIQTVFEEERLGCKELCSRLNDLEEETWGGWNNGEGITPRELGKRMAGYHILAKTIRVDEWRGNGYERSQFEDVWSRYLTDHAHLNRDNHDNPHESLETRASANHDTAAVVTVSEEGANPHESSDVTVVTVSNARETNGRQLSEGERATARDLVARERLRRQDEERKEADAQLDLGTASLDQLRRRFA
jgi:hypothetical protein